MAEHEASRGARDTTAADAHDRHSLTSRGNGGSVLAQLADDEALARQLQHSLDMESAEETAGGHNHAFGGYGDKYGDGYGEGRGYEGGRGYSGGTRSSGSRRAGGGARGAALAATLFTFAPREDEDRGGVRGDRGGGRGDRGDRDGG
jgi:hypothetical protein